MQLGTSYRQILSIALPIMLGSAAQNVIALSDSVFLYYLGEEEFAAIGFVGVFYLLVAAIGYGFSKGGQIIIARRVGARQTDEVREAFYTMLYFQTGLALFMFLFMEYGAYYFFQLIIDTPVILEKSMDYLEYRSWGVFAAYAGVALVALYTGIARTHFMLVVVLVMASTNILLDYALIFGHWGLPALGMGGAGLASTAAEIVGLLIFAGYMLVDKKIRQFHFNRLPRFQWGQIRNLFQLSLPIVAQAIVGIGSWFFFFGIIENMGERALAVSNLVRMVYLILSIPSWGFASGVNTMVSNFIGAQKRQAVLPIIWKTAKICLASTMAISIPVVLLPKTILYPLLGKEDMSLITEAQPVFGVLLAILALFAIASIYFNGLSGAGATMYGLKIQALGVAVYLAYIYLVVNVLDAGLAWAWAAELLYWGFVLAATIWYLRGKGWHEVRV
jgi:putative MATE family efflux protein